MILLFSQLLHEGLCPSHLILVLVQKSQLFRKALLLLVLLMLLSLSWIPAIPPSLIALSAGGGCRYEAAVVGGGGGGGGGGAAAGGGGGGRKTLKDLAVIKHFSLRPYRPPTSPGWWWWCCCCHSWGWARLCRGLTNIPSPPPSSPPSPPPPPPPPPPLSPLSPYRQGALIRIGGPPSAIGSAYPSSPLSSPLQVNVFM